ncbi:MAG: UDP-glucose 6-dehydrogenase, partial [Muribaculaceae bacterium]|nr:UDP-glucose 6-dehydrogenase [Muribaculaceae bacterium]
VEGADALLLVTEWKQFRSPDWCRIADKMAGNVVVDGRNVYDESELLENGFVYYKIG